MDHNFKKKRKEFYEREERLWKEVFFSDETLSQYVYRLLRTIKRKKKDEDVPEKN